MASNNHSEHVGIDELSRTVGRSVQTLRRLESQGVIPRAWRESRTQRRVWPRDEAEAIKRLLAPQFPEGESDAMRLAPTAHVPLGRAPRSDRQQLNCRTGQRP